MTVTEVVKDPETLTMTITSEFDAPIERVWQLWDDPRLLERWWGPPEYPATFLDHELKPGATVTYFMTGPDGTKSPISSWRVLAVDAPRHLELQDGDAAESGAPDPSMPISMMRVTLTARADRTHMAVEVVFESAEGMDRMLEMGVEDGMTAAQGQIDAILAAGPTRVAGSPR